MLLRHVGLTCSTEDNADKFYRDLLGLNKSEPKILPADLSHAIFKIKSPLSIINYMSGNLHFEVFITHRAFKSSPIAHQCLEVNDLDLFVEKCRKMGIKIAQIPKGDKLLTFIEDFDGNLFEIKET